MYVVSSNAFRIWALKMINVQGSVFWNQIIKEKKNLYLKYDNSFPSLTLGPSEDAYQLAAKINARWKRVW